MRTVRNQERHTLTILGQKYDPAVHSSTTNLLHRIRSPKFSPAGYMYWLSAGLPVSEPN